MDHYYHFSVRKWVVWTFVAGVVIGVYVLGNLAAWEQTTPVHLRLALIIGAFFWGLFALFAWSADSIEVSARAVFIPHAPLPAARHPEWEAKARTDAIRSRAAEHTGESHLST